MKFIRRRTTPPISVSLFSALCNLTNYPTVNNSERGWGTRKGGGGDDAAKVEKRVIPKRRRRRIKLKRNQVNFEGERSRANK